MGSYYLKISDKAKEWVERISPGKTDWKTVLFEDITEKGSQITYVDIKTSSGRPAIGLCGETFFCEAGKDYHRKDTLFLYKVYSADRRLPKTSPNIVKGKFIFFSQAESPWEKLSDVGHIFGEVDGFKESCNEEVKPDFTKVKIIEKGGAILKGASAALRKEWHPNSPHGVCIDQSLGLELMRKIWRLFKLEKYMDSSPRQKGVLDGAIKPNLNDPEYKNFLNLFNTSMINAFVQDSNQEREDLFRLIGLMKELPLPEYTRGAIWQSMAYSLEPNDLRRELKSIVQEINIDDSNHVNTWQSLILDVTKNVAKKNRDNLLLRMATEAETFENPIQYIIQWTDRIQFDSSEKGIDVFHAKERKTAATKGFGEPPLCDISQQQVEFKRTEIEQADKSKKLEVEEWVIQTRTPELSNINVLKEKMTTRFQDFFKNIEDVKTVKDVERLVETFTLFRDFITQDISLLPDPIALKNDLKEAQTCFDDVGAIMGENLYPLMRKGVTPKDMTEIADIVRHGKILYELPDWVWAEHDELAVNKVGKNDRFILLTNPIVRSRINKLIPDLLEIMKDTPGFVKDLSDPPEGVPIDNYLSSLIKEGKKFSSILSELENIHHRWTRTAITWGIHEDQLQKFLHDLDRIRSQSNDDVFKGIIEKVELSPTQEDLEKTIILYDAAIKFFKENFGGSEHAVLAMLDSWIKKNEDTICNNSQKGRNHEIELTLQHNWVDHPSQRVPLVYYDYTNVNGQYGFVTVPLLFSTRTIHKDLHFSLIYEINSQLTNMWPTNWVKPAPESISIPTTQWRKQNDSFVFSFKVRIPVRKPNSEMTKISLKLKAYDEDGHHRINIRKTLHWEQILIGEKEGIKYLWPDGVNTGYVDEHPIGPQEHLTYIENRVLSGSSFAVVAPRRFGKTTLAQYLMEKADSLKFVIPKPVLCTGMAEGSSTISYKKVWDWFSKSLVEILHSPIDFDGDEKLPGPKAFDHVRLAAKKAGKDAIVLIIDEAQLFFPKSDGRQIGTMLKDILELDWSRRDTEDKVPVYFGLIGLPGMLERMGANLQGFLMAKDIRTLKEETLNKLIYKFTRNQLHTTREAREMLSRKAGNLFVLKTLLQKLTDHVNDDKRNWANFEDVKDVIEKLKSRLIDLSEIGLEGYLRDILNEAEDINFWKPRPCYPVAVALAKAYSENISTVNAIKRAKDILNNWCLNTGFDGIKRLVYTDSQIDEHLQKLKELGVIDNRSGFQSDIHEAWLQGISIQFPADKEDREALFRGALTRIRLPEGREKIHAGSQADIFRFSQDQVDYALRTVSLHKQRDRKRFHDTIEVLKILKKHTDLRSPGTEFIYNLRDVGIADNEGSEYDGMIGVEIYQWVDGICLTDKVGRLNPLIIADLGFKLSRSLRFIHGYDIFHRDICPRNIILENTTANPVLIDFGLAKYSSYPMNTIIESDYTAPEIFGNSPRWSSAADVFSLGKTLYSLISYGNQNGNALIDLLNKCMDEDAASRPNASTLVEQFEQILPSLHVSEKQSVIWEGIQHKCQNDKDKDWFLKVIEKFKPRFLSVSMGLHDEIFDRCAEVAQFLDFILEAYPTKEPLKLSYVFNKNNDVTGDRMKGKECIKFMSNLRIERSHYDPKKNKTRILQQFKNPDDLMMIEWAKESANLMAECTKLYSLPFIINDLLGQ